MSQEAMRQMQQLLNDVQAEGLERTVGMAVAFYAHPQTGLSFPGNRVLMGDWGLAERTIQVALRRLEELGALHRQPEHETRTRRRVYLVGTGQLALLDEPQSRAQTEGAEQGAELHAPSSVRAHHCNAPAPFARVREGNQGTVNNNPPVTPPLAATPVAVLSDLHQANSSTPRFPVAVERAAPARRRRRRRRPDEQGSVASEPCPLQHTENDSEEKNTSLLEIWDELDSRFRERLGTHWEVGCSSAHPHRIEGQVLLIGLAPSVVSWASQRIGVFLEEIAGHPVRLIGCEAAAL